MLFKSNQNMHTDTQQTFLRIRPRTEAEIAAGPPCITVLDDGHSVLYHPRAKTARTPNDIQYSFTEVLDEHATQEGVFATTALRGVRDVLQMKNNALVFTLGVTNSGKTFTMQGTEFNAGIVPRSITTLFTGLSRNMAPSYTFKVDDATRVPYVQVSEPLLDVRASLSCNTARSSGGSGHQQRPGAQSADLAEPQCG